MLGNCSVIQYENRFELNRIIYSSCQKLYKAEETTAPKTEMGSKYCFRLLCEHDQVRFSHMIYKMSRMTRDRLKILLQASL